MGDPHDGGMPGITEQPRYFPFYFRTGFLQEWTIL